MNQMDLQKAFHDFLLQVTSLFMDKLCINTGKPVWNHVNAFSIKRTNKAWKILFFQIKIPANYLHSSMAHLN